MHLFRRLKPPAPSESPAPSGIFEDSSEALENLWTSYRRFPSGTKARDHLAAFRARLKSLLKKGIVWSEKP